MDRNSITNPLIIGLPFCGWQVKELSLRLWFGPPKDALRGLGGRVRVWRRFPRRGQKP